MISLLLRFGANPNRRDSWGKTALDYGSDDEEAQETKASELPTFITIVVSVYLYIPNIL